MKDALPTKLSADAWKKMWKKARPNATAGVRNTGDLLANELANAGSLAKIMVALRELLLRSILEKLASMEQGGFAANKETRNLKAVATQWLSFDIYQENKANRPQGRTLKSLGRGYQYEAPRVYFHGEHPGVGGIPQEFAGLKLKQLPKRYAPRVGASNMGDDLHAANFAQYHTANKRLLKQGLATLEQLSKGKRLDCLVFPQAGRFYKDPILTVLHNTQDMEIYVVDEYNNYYTQIGNPGVFNHSSFVRGKPIYCAGTILINQGVLEMISNDSGHYKPAPTLLKDVVDDLLVRGFDNFEVGCKKPNPFWLAPYKGASDQQITVALGHDPQLKAVAALIRGRMVQGRVTPGNVMSLGQAVVGYKANDITIAAFSSLVLYYNSPRVFSANPNGAIPTTFQFSQ